MRDPPGMRFGTHLAVYGNKLKLSFQPLNQQPLPFKISIQLIQQPSPFGCMSNTKSVTVKEVFVLWSTFRRITNKWADLIRYLGMQVLIPYCRHQRSPEFFPFMLFFIFMLIYMPYMRNAQYRVSRLLLEVCNIIYFIFINNHIIVIFIVALKQMRRK